MGIVKILSPLIVLNLFPKLNPGGFEEVLLSELNYVVLNHVCYFNLLHVCTALQSIVLFT